MLVDRLLKSPPYFLSEVFNCELAAFENNPPPPVPVPNKPLLPEPKSPPAGLFYVDPAWLPNNEGVGLLLGFGVFLSVGLLNILPTLWTILK